MKTIAKTEQYDVNFINQPDMVEYLGVEMSAEDFLVKLRLIMPEECKPHERVTFLKENSGEWPFFCV